MVRNLRWFTLLLATALLMTLAPAVAAAPDDPGPPDDPGVVPPGLALKTFIHYPKGHGKNTDVAKARQCSDTSPSGCGEYSIATTSSGKPIRWASPSGVPYYVTLNYSTKKSRNLAKDAALAAINESFATWQAASDAGLSYSYKGAPTGKVLLPKLDGKNVVGWKSIQSTALAITYVWYYSDTGYIAEFDMVFNNSYAWTYSPPTGIDSAVPYDDPDNIGVAGSYDLRDIGTHEAGHTLMLDDMYDPSHANLTMYGYGAPAELKKDTLAYGDDLGVDAIY